MNPIEIVAKMPINKHDDISAHQFNDLIMEDHIIKMAKNKDYVCEVLEEIITFDTNK